MRGSERKPGLCLSRKIGQQINLLTQEGRTEIYIEAFAGKRAQVRVLAPPAVKIMRGELTPAA